MGVTVAWGGWVGKTANNQPQSQKPRSLTRWRKLGTHCQLIFFLRMSPHPPRPLEGNKVDLFLRSGLPQSGDPGLSEHLIQANESEDDNEAVCLDLSLSACGSFPCSCAICKAKVDVTVSYHRYAHMGTVIMTEEIMLITRGDLYP